MANGAVTPSARSDDDSDAPGFLARQRAARPWLDHAVRAGKRYQDQNGDYYAAGVTYYSVLSIFPLLMVAFAAAGFVLANNPDLLDQLRDQITKKVPGSFGGTVKDLIDTAINSRSTVGILGLLGALYSGIGWMAKLRDALTAQWEQQRKKANFVKTKIFDLGALVGLGVALVVSLALSGVSAGSIGRKILSVVGLENAPGVGVGLQIVSALLAIAAAWALFTWVIARLPREPVTMRSAVRAALLAAIVFEIFSQVAKYYLKSVLSSPAGVAFGPIIGLMVFAFFTWRIVLFATAWAATTEENLKLAVHRPPDPAIIRPQVQVGRSGAGGALLAVGAGALLALGVSRRSRREK